MPNNSNEDLRNHLFMAIEALNDPDDSKDVEAMKMEIERAKAIATVADKILDSAKVELRFLELKGQEATSRFLQPKTEALAITDGRSTNGNGNGRH